MKSNLLDVVIGDGDDKNERMRILVGDGDIRAVKRSQYHGPRNI